MAKLTKKEKVKIEMQMAVPARRGDTWVGCRPTVFKSKNDIKAQRRESKRLCMDY